jgi:hypothetical protein
VAFGPKNFMAFGTGVCAKCYDVIHNISHAGRDSANDLLRLSHADLETALAPALFYAEPNYGRVPILRMSCEAWIEKRFQTYACTTSRDGETRYLPFRLKGTFLWNVFVGEEGLAASRETFRLAFNNVNALWGKPRFKSECKSCRFCWEKFSCLHVLRVKRTTLSL